MVFSVCMKNWRIWLVCGGCTKIDFGSADLTGKSTLLCRLSIVYRPDLIGLLTLWQQIGVIEACEISYHKRAHISCKCYDIIFLPDPPYDLTASWGKRLFDYSKVVMFWNFNIFLTTVYTEMLLLTQVFRPRDNLLNDLNKGIEVWRYIPSHVILVSTSFEVRSTIILCFIDGAAQ